MPRQLQRGYLQRAAILKYALHVVVRGFLLVHIGRREETSGRHLLWIAHHYQRFATGYGSHGLACGHLRGFVKHHKVELIVGKTQILRHAHRAHQHTWAKAGQQCRHLHKEVAHGQSASTIAHIATQQTYLTAVVKVVGHTRHIGGQPGI